MLILIKMAAYIQTREMRLKSPLHPHSHRNLLVISLWLLSSLSVSASDPVQISVTKSNPGEFHISGIIRDLPDPNTIWEVLTDYEGMSEWISMMQSSQTLQRKSHSAIIKQISQGKAYFMKKTITLELELQETPKKVIAFKDLAEIDFKSYSGSWRISLDEQGIFLRYEVTMQPRLNLPAFLIKPAYQKNSEALLHEVRKEILRRAKD